MRFASFEKFKKIAADRNGGILSPTALVVCGGLAGGCEAVLAVTPIESIKVSIELTNEVIGMSIIDYLLRMPQLRVPQLKVPQLRMPQLRMPQLRMPQLMTKISFRQIKFVDDLNSPKQKYKGLFHGIRTIIKEQGQCFIRRKIVDNCRICLVKRCRKRSWTMSFSLYLFVAGLRGIYQGCSATVIKSVTSQGTRFLVIESLKDRYRRRNPGELVPTYLVLIFGAIGGGVSVCVNAPVDVVKSRMQGLDAHKYRSTLHCAKTILKHEGFVA